MKSLIHLGLTVALFAPTLLLSACSTQGVQDTRQRGVENRQDRIDSRYYSRQERWKERGEREDARAQARMDNW